VLEIEVAEVFARGEDKLAEADRCGRDARDNFEASSGEDGGEFFD